MDATQLSLAALAFAGSCIAQNVADAALQAAWTRITFAYQRWRGAEPTAETLKPEKHSQAAADPAIIQEAEAIFGMSSGLRRARSHESIWRGARILWVDDYPENNAWERSVLRAFGVESVNVETTRSAVALLERERFDVIISDIERDGHQKEGVRALPELQEVARGARVIFYVGNLLDAPTPVGAFGITNNPNELLHLMLDVLERQRT